MPETRYARSGDVMVAYQVLGEGPFDVVYVPGAISHVELQWDAAGRGTLLRGLAEHARVLVFDKRGTGMSDRVAGVPTLEERSDDIRAPDYPFGETEREYRKGSEENVEDFVAPGGIEAAVRSGFPSAGEQEVRARARVLRYGASPGSAAALGEMNKAIDVRPVLDAISASTLVLHQHADPWVQVEHGRYLAERIPGAVYAELDGKEHIPTGAFVPQLLESAEAWMVQQGAAQPGPARTP